MWYNSIVDNRQSEKNLIVGTIITLLGASLWGLCAVVGKYLMVKGLDTVWMVNFRMLSAGLIMLAYAAIRNPHHFCDIWKDRKSVGRLLLIAIFGFGICQVTYFLAIEYCNAGIATALQQTAPVFVLIFVIIKEHRKPTFTELAALLLVIIGSFMMATGGNFGSLHIPVLALVFGFASAITCTLYIMLPGKLIKKYGNFETIGWGLTLGGLMLAPISKLWIVSGTWDAGTWLGIAFIVLLGAVAAFGLYLYGTTKVGAVRASIYGLIEPVVATFASLVFLGQNFTAGDYIGIASVLLGIGILAAKK